MPHISVVIPVYRAENCLPVLYSRLKASLELITQDFEIILVEDCGGDRSWEIIQELAQVDPRVKGIQFSRNFGQHYAITAGLQASHGEYAIVMDCDLQQDPDLVPKLYLEAQKGYDVVLTEISEGKHSSWRNLCSKSYIFIVNALTFGKLLPYRFTSLSLLSRPVISAFLNIKDVHRHFTPIIISLGFPQKIVKIQHKDRFFGKSSYSFYKLIRLTVDGIISQSNALLYISASFGFLLVLISLITTFYIMFTYFIYGYQSGWTSIISILLAVGGSLHISLGIIGLYLGKTFDQSKQRPLFIIRDKINL